MKPINTSNTKVTNCTPISSNCVVWEGNLPNCIEACHGDTVVDIIYKVADKTCTVLDQIDVSNVDLKCLANPSGFFGATGTGDLVSTLNVNTSSVGNIGSGEDDLASYILVANQISKNNDYFSFEISGTIANTTSSKRIKIVFGSTTLFDTGTSGIAVSKSLDWTIKGEVIRTTATTYKSNIYFILGDSTYPASSDFVSGSTYFSNVNTFKCTGEGFITNDVVKESFIIRSHSRNTAYVPLTSDNATIQTILSELITQHCALDTRVYTLENTTVSSGGAISLSFGGQYYNCVSSFLGDSGLISSSPTINADIVEYLFKGICLTHNELTSEIKRVEGLIGTSSGTGTSTSVMVTSGCLFSGSKSIGQAWSYIDTHYCAFTAKFGTVAEVTNAITEEGVWLSDINTQLLTPLALDTISNSTTEAQMIKNLWHVVGALNDKLTSTALALSACCGFSCKKFEVTVNAINFDVAANTVGLRFGFDGSSNLPGAPYTFVDTRSTVIFTDSTGYSLSSMPVDITGILTPYTDYDITGLDFSGEIQVDVDLQFEVTDNTDPLNPRTFNCTKCLHTFFKTGIACAFCTIQVTITGDNPEVIIEYTVGTSTVVNKLVLTTEGVGMEYVLPAETTILSITNVNNSAVTVTSSTCPNLTIPAVDTLACYSFIIDNDFYDPSVGDGTSDFYYNIVGYMIGGVDVVTYPSVIRSDFHDIRSITSTPDTGFTNVSAETGDCSFKVMPTTYATWYDSVDKLKNIPSNSYIFGITKVCTKMNDGVEPRVPYYNNIIVSAVSGKDIFLKLVANDLNNTTGTYLDSTPSVYIKGIEIPVGGSCDCCYVYDGS